MSPPPFKPSRAQRRDVEVWSAGGMGEEAMARALGIARGTLRKHFATEMTIGGQKRRAEVLRAMFKAAKAGNVAAQKAFLGRTDAPPPLPDRSERRRPMGKKEVVQRDALAAGADSDWGDDLAPPNGLPN